MDIDEDVIRRIREYVIAHGRITNRESRQLLGISYDEAIKLLGELSRGGVIKRIGVMGGTKYVLPESDEAKSG